MKYLSKEKKTTTKDKAKYIFIEEGIVLKKKREGAIELPIFNLIGEFGSKVAIISSKDSILNKLKRNIKKQWRGLIGREVDNSYMIKVGDWGKAVYDIQEKKKDIKINDISILQKGLQLLSNDLQLNDELAQLKDLINSTIKPEDFIAKFFVEEFEKGKILLSNELGIILDLRQVKGNISGNVFDSIYRYAEQNISRVNNILKELDIQGIEEIDIYYIYNVSDNHKIEFRKDGVYSVVSSGDAEVETIIIDKQLNLIGWYKSDYNIFNNTLTNTEFKYYEFEGDIVFPYFPNTDAFNKKMGIQGIRMMVTGKTYQMFFSALDKRIEDNNIKERYILQHNGIDLEKKTFVHGGQLLYNESDIDYKIFAPKYAVKIGEQISLEEAKEILKGYTKRDFQYIVLLWFIGALIKNDFFKNEMYAPLLQIVGFYKSGKTEMVELIMKLMGYSLQPIRDGNITLQPRKILVSGSRPHAIQKKLGDYAPLFCDEYTGKIPEEINELFKGLYNEAPSEKGNADQSITTYKLIAPVVIGGEASTLNNALMSRSIYLQINREDRTNPKKYFEIKSKLEGKCILDDVRNKLKNADLSKYTKQFKMKDREEKNYEWLRIVNDIIGKLFTDKEMDYLIKDNLKLQKQILDGRDELKLFFSNILVIGKREQNITVVSNDKEETILDIFIPQELSEKNHAILEIKNLVGDNDNNMNNFRINVSKLLKYKKPETEWIIKSLFRHLANYRNRTWQSFIYEYISYDE